MDSIGSSRRRDGERSAPTVVLCCRPVLLFPWRFVLGFYGVAPSAPLWRLYNLFVDAANRPVQFRAAESKPFAPRQLTLFGARPGPDSCRPKPPRAPLNK